LKTLGMDWLRGMIYQAVFAVLVVIFGFLLAAGGMAAMSGIMDLWSLSVGIIGAVVLAVWVILTIFGGKLITFLAELIPAD